MAGDARHTGSPGMGGRGLPRVGSAREWAWGGRGLPTGFPGNGPGLEACHGSPGMGGAEACPTGFSGNGRAEARPLGPREMGGNERGSREWAGRGHPPRESQGLGGRGSHRVPRERAGEARQRVPLGNWTWAKARQRVPREWGGPRLATGPGNGPGEASPTGPREGLAGEACHGFPVGNGPGEASPRVRPGNGRSRPAKGPGNGRARPPRVPGNGRAGFAKGPGMGGRAPHGFPGMGWGELAKTGSPGRAGEVRPGIGHPGNGRARPLGPGWATAVPREWVGGSPRVPGMGG
ncbi:collagen alpha-2(I) chain-like [Macrobrachium nipponense]|uniref:collagen alpha-2(I) chain-like n=1 Tax=Macrobrachium nipponense TaxID=159736 RepID=UPI0030C8371D